MPARQSRRPRRAQRRGAALLGGRPAACVGCAAPCGQRRLRNEVRRVLATRTVLAAIVAATAAAPAHASVTLGQSNAPSDSCGSNQLLLQQSTAGSPSYAYASQTNGVIV